MFISLNPDNPEIWHLIDAVQILREGGVIAYPTDTVYGIGCDLLNKQAIEKLYSIKKIPKRKLLSIICNDLTHISEYARVSNTSYRLMKRLLPGPYTFILPATHKVPRLMLTNRRTIGIRIPDNHICRAILDNFENPIISTSLILSEDEVVSDPFRIFEAYGSQLDAVIDGGVLKSDVSTIIDLSEREPVIVRQGKGEIKSLL